MWGLGYVIDETSFPSMSIEENNKNSTRGMNFVHSIL